VRGSGAKQATVQAPHSNPGGGSQCKTFIRSTNDLLPQPQVKASVVGTLYRKWIMPLTKEVEVAYLLRRLEDE
jgi:hypothetical protein